MWIIKYRIYSVSIWIYISISSYSGYVVISWSTSNLTLFTNEPRKMNISFAERWLFYFWLLDQIHNVLYTSSSISSLCRFNVYITHANFWNHNIYPWDIWNADWYPWIQIRKFKLAQKWLACSAEKYPMNNPRISTATENKYPRTPTERTPFHVDYFPANSTRATRVFARHFSRGSRVGEKDEEISKIFAAANRTEVSSERTSAQDFSQTYLFIRRGDRVDVRQRRRSGRAGTNRGDRPRTFPKPFLGPVTSYDQRQGSQHQRTETQTDHRADLRH